MAASEGLAGFGTFLLWNFAKVLRLTSISGPAESRATIDVSSHDSPDGYREFVAGRGSGGEVPLEGNLCPEDTLGQVAFHTDMQAGTKRDCLVVPPMAVGVAWHAEAFATGFEGSYPYDGKIGVRGSLAVTGKPTYLNTQATGMSDLSGVEEDASALVITPAIAVDTYAYACEVDTTCTYVKLTVTAVGHTVYVQGEAEATGVETDEITLGDAGTDTEILIVVYESDSELTTAPRLYVLTVTRPAA